jgi:GDP-L-fucose synthase
MNELKKLTVYVAGHQGMVGSAIVRLLLKRGFDNLLLRSSSELDLRDSDAVKEFFDRSKPQVVILAAARVGGIQANIDRPADFLFENLSIQNNVIHQSFLHNVNKLCFLGSSCIYPRNCPQPMKEEYLLTGPLEPTNEGYAIAKIAGLKMIEFYHRQYGFPGISVMPCNLYGTNDTYDLLRSHVISALIKKFVDAVECQNQTVTVWGTGKARREFMHVDDAAAAILDIIERYENPRFINIGWGSDISILDLVNIIADEVGFHGRIEWDNTKSDGMPVKCMDVTRMKDLGFQPSISLQEGIRKSVAEYRSFGRKRGQP